MRLDKQDITYAEKAEEEHMAGEFYRLYFNRMTGIDMEIACTIYGKLIKPGERLMPANLWFKNLNT
jgi:hypothetical protein